MLLFTETTSEKKLADKADSREKEEEEEAACHFAVNTDTDRQSDRVRKSAFFYSIRFRGGKGEKGCTEKEEEEVLFLNSVAARHRSRKRKKRKTELRQVTGRVK